MQRLPQTTHPIHLFLLAALLLPGATVRAQSGFGLPIAAELETREVGFTITHYVGRRYMPEWRAPFTMYVNDPYNAGRASYSVLPTVFTYGSALIWALFSPRGPGSEVDRAQDRARTLYIAIFGSAWLANSRHHLIVAGPRSAQLSAFGGIHTDMFTPSGQGEVVWVRAGPEVGLRFYRGKAEPDLMTSNSFQGMSLEVGARHHVDIVHDGRSAIRGFLGLTFY